MIGKAWLTRATHSMLASEEKDGREDGQEGESQVMGDFILCGTDAQIWGRSFLWKRSQIPPEVRFENTSQSNQIDNQDKPNNQT